MLPADIILLVFSFLPLSNICQLLKETTKSRHILNFYVKQVFLARVKHERWTLALITPSTYFAILCNRDMQMYSRPITKLTCVGYNSVSQYLQFESTKPPFDFELADEELEFQSMSIYCSQWFSLLKEDNTSGQIKLCWREGEQIKQLNKDLWIAYNCTKKAPESADPCCKHNSRCNKHSFISCSNEKKRLLHIHSICVSLNWLRQGL